MKRGARFARLTPCARGHAVWRAVQVVFLSVGAGAGGAGDGVGAFSRDWPLGPRGISLGCWHSGVAGAVSELPGCAW